MIIQTAEPDWSQVLSLLNATKNDVALHESHEQQGYDRVLYGTLKDVRAAGAARKRSMT